MLLQAALFVLVTSQQCFAESPKTLQSLKAVRKSPPNLIGDETSLDGYQMGNQESLSLMPMKLSSAMQDELLLRMQDAKQIWEIRMLYAVVLANQGNTAAQKFIIDRYQAAGDDHIYEVMQAIYWTWRMPWFDQFIKDNPPTPDMKWAEELMLAALSDKRLIHIDVSISEDFAIRTLAVHYGSFEIILTAQKSKKALPVFCNFVTESLQLAPEEDLFPEGLGFNEVSKIVNCLAEFDDVAVEPVMLEVVRCAVLKKADEWALSYAMKWLVARKNQAVIDIAKEGLDLGHIYDALIGTKHAPYLDAIRAKLAELKDGDLVGPELYRQSCARTAAKLILIMGDKADPVPKLMDFVDDSNNERRNDAIYLLKEIKDPRCVSWAEKTALVEKQWFALVCLIELLGEIPGDSATEALINLLDAPFDKVRSENDIHYKAQDNHLQISAELEKRTGKKFGVNSAPWRKWLSDSKK